MKVLVAEDDLNILNGLVELLEKEGWTAIAARHGREAVDKWREEKPQAVILDIMMPEMNGYDVCKEIRKSDQNIPVLFLSAKSEEVDKVLGLELGADDFISKPFGTRELMARVRAATRRVIRDATVEGHKPEGSFDIGDLRVEAAQLRAYRKDTVIDLGPRDIKILRLLAEKPGQAISRDQMFDACWGLDFAANSRSLDQHISQLRKRIEVDPKDPRLILTVHGVGYRYDKF